MNTTIKLAGAAALAFALAVPAVVPAQAQQFGYGYDQPAPVYGPTYGARAYAPNYAVRGPAMGAYAYAPGPAEGSWGGDYSSWNEQACTTSPASLSFQPCMNRGGGR